MPVSDRPQDGLILHIPHSGTEFPWLEGYIRSDLIQAEVDLLTDWHSDRIFSRAEAAVLCPAFSRVFCDVERFVPDDLEPMAARGMGFFYTHTDSGLEFRVPENTKEKVYLEYWLPHHQTLRDLTADRLERLNRVVLIDCHTFSRQPFRRETDQDPQRPDICLGTEGRHTPDWLLEACVQVWSQAGFSVAVNKPYSGSLVPDPWRGQDDRVLSLMVEINRRLYLRGDTGPAEIPGAVETLNGVFQQMLDRVLQG